MFDYYFPVVFGLTIGLLAHSHKLIFTNKLSLEKETKFDICHVYVALDFTYEGSNTAISEHHICICTTFSVVPMNVFI
jgi:hypothetical protein